MRREWSLLRIPSSVSRTRAVGSVRPGGPDGMSIVRYHCTSITVVFAPRSAWWGTDFRPGSRITSLFVAHTNGASTLMTVSRRILERLRGRCHRSITSSSSSGLTLPSRGRLRQKCRPLIPMPFPIVISFIVIEKDRSFIVRNLSDRMGPTVRSIMAVVVASVGARRMVSSLGVGETSLRERVALSPFDQVLKVRLNGYLHQH